MGHPFKLIKERYAKLTAQKGVATLLTILLASLGVVSASMGIVYTIRGTQDQELVVHTSAHSKLRAWDGVEVVRLYLKGLSSSALTALPVGGLSVDGLTGVTAAVVSNDVSGSSRRVVVNVTGSGSGSATTIQAVYDVSPGALMPDNVVYNPAIINIAKGFTSTGDINVVGAPNALINVSGNVNISGSSNVSRICSTGNVVLSSGIALTSVCANGTLTMSGSASVTNATIIGNVNLSSNATIANLTSNGVVTLSGSNIVGAITTKGNVVLSGASTQANSIRTEGNINWASGLPATSLNANGTVSYAGMTSDGSIPVAVINAIGNVTLSGNGTVKDVNTKGLTTINGYYGTGIVGTLNGEGGLNWTNGITVNSGTVGGTINPVVPNPNWGNPVNVTTVTGKVVNVPAISVATLTPVTVSPVTVDTSVLKSSANYVFEIDGGGKRIVTVKNVNGITDGTYFLGNYPTWNVALNRNPKDFLCTAVDASNNCTAPTTPYKTLCQGFDPNVGCFTYDATAKKWTVSGLSMAPGAAWFSDSLFVSNGKYFNTFMATGNITTGGSLVVYSPNYGGYQPVCNNNASAQGVALVNPDFADMYPTNYCNTSTSTYRPNALANIALVAGSYTGGVFSGGNITLGNQSDIYGGVLAGNQLATTGAISIHGQIYVSAQATTSVASNWGASLTIDLSLAPSTYSATQVPCMGPCTAASPTSAVSKVYWTRYM